MCIVLRCFHTVLFWFYFSLFLFPFCCFYSSSSNICFINFFLFRSLFLATVWLLMFLIFISILLFSWNSTYRISSLSAKISVFLYHFCLFPCYHKVLKHLKKKNCFAKEEYVKQPILNILCVLIARYILFHWLIHEFLQNLSLFSMKII